MHDGVRRMVAGEVTEGRRTDQTGKIVRFTSLAVLPHHITTGRVGGDGGGASRLEEMWMYTVPLVLSCLAQLPHKTKVTFSTPSQFIPSANHIIITPITPPNPSEPLLTSRLTDTTSAAAATTASTAGPCRG